MSSNVSGKPVSFNWNASEQGSFLEPKIGEESAFVVFDRRTKKYRIVEKEKYTTTLTKLDNQVGAVRKIFSNVFGRLTGVAKVKHEGKIYSVDSKSMKSFMTEQQTLTNDQIYDLILEKKRSPEGKDTPPLAPRPLHQLSKTDFKRATESNNHLTKRISTDSESVLSSLKELQNDKSRKKDYYILISKLNRIFESLGDESPLHDSELRKFILQLKPLDMFTPRDLKRLTEEPGLTALKTRVRERSENVLQSLKKMEKNPERREELNNLIGKLNEVFEGIDEKDAIRDTPLRKHLIQYTFASKPKPPQNEAEVKRKESFEAAKKRPPAPPPPLRPKPSPAQPPAQAPSAEPIAGPPPLPNRRPPSGRNALLDSIRNGQPPLRPAEKRELSPQRTDSSNASLADILSDSMKGRRGDIEGADASEEDWDDA